MKKRVFCLLSCVFAMLLFYQYILHPFYHGRPVQPQFSPAKKILLVPLDGRPPCRQFVMDAGRIAGYEVIPPPSEIQDYYSLPGNTTGLQSWLQENIGHADALILSIDQFLYGGLLAAREKDASQEEISAMLAFLKKLHADHPNIPIYAFSILPRLTPQDTIDGYYEKRWLMEYSRLVGKKAAGLPVDDEEIASLEAKISPESMEKYLSHFRGSTALNKQLAELAKEGVLARLILGQDDGEAYSIPNIEKEALRRYLAEKGISEKQVFLTHGADEIALTLLAEIKMRETHLVPRIFVKYNDEKSGSRIMPYMAISTEETVQEKLGMMNAVPAPSPEEADFTLFISTNNSDEDTLGSRATSVRYLQQAWEQEHPVALVDLSKHFFASEILLPQLIRENYPINSLIAYAGWNTASNSIGTVLAQSCLFLAQQKEATTTQDAINLYAANLTFLQNRFLEDAFYLKDVIDLVNTSLIKAGYTNTADLDLEHNARWANAMLQHAMKERIHAYKETRAFRQPISFATPTGRTTLRISDITADMSYPWPRTFEINLQSSIQLEELEP